jgi:SecD/SecF fusion protein
MQNKGLIRTFAIIFGVICVYYLSFTWVNNTIEDDAKLYANGDAQKETAYLDSVANLPIANYGFTKYTYKEVQDKAINLGLDLKGGIDATLEVSVKDILFGLSNKSKNAVFNKALADATAAQKNSDSDYLDLFFDAFDAASNGSVQLSDPSIFGNKTLKDKINFKLTDDEVKPILQEEVKGSISTAFEVLRSRIDRFGVTSPNISQIGESGRILIELPGAKDIDRVKKLLQSTAELQFWEVYENTETANFFIQANTLLAEILKDETASETEEAIDSATAQQDELDELLGDVQDSVDTKAANPLFTLMNPNIPQNAQQRSSAVAYASIKDTATVNNYLAKKEVRALLPAEMTYVKMSHQFRAM